MGNSPSSRTNVSNKMSLPNIYQYIVKIDQSMLHIANVCNPIQWTESDHAEVSEKIATLTGNVISHNIYDLQTELLGFPATVLYEMCKSDGRVNLTTIFVGFAESHNRDSVVAAATATITKILAWSGPYRVNPQMSRDFKHAEVRPSQQPSYAQTSFTQDVPEWLIKFRQDAAEAPPQGLIRNVGQTLGLSALAVGVAYATGKGLGIDTRAKNQIKEKEDQSYSQNRRLMRAHEKLGMCFKTYSGMSYSQETLDTLLHTLVDVLEDTAVLLGEKEYGSAKELVRAETK